MTYYDTLTRRAELCQHVEGEGKAVVRRLSYINDEYGTACSTVYRTSPEEGCKTGDTLGDQSGRDTELMGARECGRHGQALMRAGQM